MSEGAVTQQESDTEVGGDAAQTKDPVVAHGTDNGSEPVTSKPEGDVISEQPTADTAKSTEGGLAPQVAAHYNTLPEAGKEKRLESRIFFQRNFNNWIKSMCISDALRRLRKQDMSRKVVALDLCCGKGGDLLKWKKGNIGHLVCADIAAVSVEQCEIRYKDLGNRNRNDRYPVFTAEFYTADCADQRLTDLYKDPDMTFDLTSCQFSFHYSFESIRRADTMLRNACERLRPGGLFVGTMPNGCELVRRLKNSEGLSFGNDVYRVTFKNKDDFPLFGCIYDFHLEGVVDCPEFLVYFPLLEKMAQKYGMRLLYSETFAEFFKRHSGDRDNSQLLGRMKALEVYPPSERTSAASQTAGDYDHAVDHINNKKNDGDERNMQVGTLSKAEWEATSLYLVYAFMKEDPSKIAAESAAEGTEQGEPSSAAPDEAGEESATTSQGGQSAVGDEEQPPVKKPRTAVEGREEERVAEERTEPTPEEISEAESAVLGLAEQPT